MITTSKWVYAAYEGRTIDKVQADSYIRRERQYTERKPTPYERTRSQVYATGNRWQIENFEATHGRGW